MTWHLILVPCHCYSLILNGAEYQWLSSILLPSSLSASWKGSYKIKLAELRWILVTAYKVEYSIRIRIRGHCTTRLSYRLRDWSLNPNSFLIIFWKLISESTRLVMSTLYLTGFPRKESVYENYKQNNFFLDTWLDGTFKKIRNPSYRNNNLIGSILSSIIHFCNKSINPIWYDLHPSQS